jgi:hypothetical protein
MTKPLTAAQHLADSKKRWLKHREDGTIYEWNEILSVHPKCMEVTYEVAFPERFTTPETIQGLAAALKDSKLSTSLKTDLPPENTVAPSINEDASRNMPSIAGAGAGLKPPA